MRSKCKKLITDITRKNDLENNIDSYAKLLACEYNHYATVKMSMNYYTMKEVILEQEDKNTDLCKYFNIVSELIKKHVLDRNCVDDKAMEGISQIRDNIEYKMKNLTAFADGYEIYEYILNRIEYGIKGETEDVDIEQLSAKMFQYVFSENDTVVVNSKLQLLMSQLPVRMTKNKFYDVVANTLSIYKGGEVNSVNDFADMIRTAVLIKRPKGFDNEYPYLYHVFTDLEQADYKNMDIDTFNDLTDRLTKAAEIINNEVSAYMLLQEIVNDVYTLLLTVDKAYDTNLSGDGYKSAIEILKACYDATDMEYVPEELMPQFISIEGVQESVYENVIILEASFDDVKSGNIEVIEKLNLMDDFNALETVSKLLSTSLFIDLKKESSGDGEIADSLYINDLKEQLTNELKTLFTDKDRIVTRSIMCKILASMPIFLNTQQEIKNYFDYVLSNCKDDSELTACKKLVSEIIEED
ncbi:MAG: hypothetical protein E7259_03625 [Lachnospiraceae bacterium]|nr:hypothetical protein [Lachnospiraceae bacterium]